ncbi:electron transfer flavoprotein subunit beta/FixA family protein [Parolsenella catena]|uniref:electron transfer flavoprotein subunit beta/FixA family protein n=1 Tax=Parolsenella catena TaxID=2003188 RepID=UPI002FDEC188
MRSVVCMKAVPSTTEVRMDPKTNTIIRDGRQSVANPFDTAALEVALALKDELGGRVSVLSMGIPDTCRLLRDAISRGADDALLLSDRAFAGADTLATSYALSMGLDELGDADLVLCGKMAVDGDTAQIGPELGGILGVPCVTGVSEVLEASDHRVVVRHDTDEGTEVVEVPLPAVLTVTKDIATLRMPSIAGVRAAAGAEVRVLDAATLGADPACCGLAGSPTQVVRSFVPERSHEAATIAGTPAEQAAALLEVFEEVAR